MEGRSLTVAARKLPKYVRAITVAARKTLRVAT